MEKDKLDALREINLDAVTWELTNACRGVISVEDDSGIYLAAYVLLRVKMDNSIRYKSLEDFIASSGDQESRCMFLRKTLQNAWNAIICLIDKFEEEELQAFILFYEPSGRMISEHTPVGVSRLAAKIMNVQPGDYVADFCTGRGGFIRECVALQPDAKYYGNDINTAAVEIASIRAQILGGEINIVQEDVFDMKDKVRTFDVAFANYPFGMRAKDAWKSGFNQYEETIKKHPEFSRAVSLDWLFNRVTYNAINGPRRAVCIMTNGSTWNTLDREARRHFISRGIVEAVISLPTNLFDSTDVGTVMIILSHGNMSTMMVDARNMCVQGRRYNTITDKNIDEIITAFSTEGKHSKQVSYQELEENDFVLNPIRYLTEAVSVEDGVPFATVIKRITRGAPMNAADLDKLSSSVPINTQYLMLANIKDGIIDDELPYLKDIDQRQEKYCIKNKSLIISKNGYPYKVAVAEVPEGRQILANGNLFVIELDEEKANPYFIKAYLESDIGIAALNSITVGATIPIIGVDQLKRITVPCPSLKEQSEIENKYLTLVDEIKLLRRKMNKATSNLKHLFDESKEG